MYTYIHAHVLMCMEVPIDELLSLHISSYHSRSRSDLKSFVISRSVGFPIELWNDGNSIYTRENVVSKCGNSCENRYDVYGDFREDLLEILAVVMFEVGFPPSAVYICRYDMKRYL